MSAPPPNGFVHYVGGGQPGWRLAVKDNIEVAGMPCAAGLLAWRGRVAQRDAPCVARLKAAGYHVVGKTLMDEAAFGALGDNPYFGRCHNPRRHGYTAGGSSAGSAAAVAAGLADAALGTDTLGSVRIPAAYCGVVGYIPSPGVIPTDGVVPLAPSFDRVGVLAPSVAHAARAAGIRPEFRKATLGVLDETRAVAARLEAGAIVPMQPLDWKALRRAALLLVEREGARVLAEELASLSLPVRAALQFGRDADAQRVERAHRTVAALSGWPGACDIAVLPTTPGPAFAFDAPPPEDQADYTVPANVLGLPAISVPFGTSADGLPLGMQLVARRGADALLLGVAEALEAT